MVKKYLNITIDPVKMIGLLLQAIVKQDTLSISISENKIETPNAPEYVNSNKGVSVWVRESKF